MKICSVFLLLAVGMSQLAEGESYVVRKYDDEGSGFGSGMGGFADDTEDGSDEIFIEDEKVAVNMSWSQASPNDIPDGLPSPVDPTAVSNADRNDLNSKTKSIINPVDPAIVSSKQWKALMVLTATNAEMEDPDFLAKWVNKRAMSAK